MGETIRRPLVLTVMLMSLHVGTVQAAPQCTGDCNGDSEVLVDEIIRGVNIALGTLALTECERFDGDLDQAVTVDEILTAVTAGLQGCPAGDRDAFVVVTNFTTGSFGTISLDQPRIVEPGSSQRQIHSDALARSNGGLVYVLNRFMGDSIQVLDPQAGYATRARCSTGELTNPQDIAFLTVEKAYVTLFDKPRLLIIDPSRLHDDCDGLVQGNIDLSPYADADGLPESHVMAIVGDRLYVVLQKLDRDNFFTPAGPGKLLVIDTSTDMVVNEITLTSGNPFSQTNGLTVRGDSLLLAETNQFGVNDGGIERVDLRNGTPQGFFVTEQTLGGDLTDFVIVADDLGYAVISLSDFTNQLVRFNPITGEKLDTVLSGGNYADIELNDRGELWVAESTFGNAGVRIFRASDGQELTESPIDLTLPPFTITFVQ